MDERGDEDRSRSFPADRAEGRGPPRPAGTGEGSAPVKRRKRGGAFPEVAPFDFCRKPIPEELPYSMAARYRQALLLRTTRVLKRDLFGVGLALPATLPRNLQRFSQTLFGLGGDVDHLLVRHTAYPYLASVLDPQSRKLLKASLLGDSHAFGKRKGLWGTTTHRTLLFCPECVRADLGRAGQAAWKRTHQLQGVFVCPEHEIGLRSSNAPTVARDFLACPEDPGAGTPVEPPFGRALALSVARQTTFLLAQPIHAPSRERLGQAVARLAAAAGWADDRGRVSRELCQRVIETFGTDGSVWGTCDAGVIRRRIRSAWKTARPAPSPFTHLAVLAVLGLEFKDLANALRTNRAPAQGKAARASNGSSLFNSREAKLSRHKQVVADVLRSMPGASKREARPAAGASLDYLQKHDRHWLVANFPRMPRPPKWSDRELAATVPGIARTLLAAPDRPARVSVRILSRAVRTEGFVERNKARLPMTLAALRLHAETPRSFIVAAGERRARERVERGERLYWVDLKIQLQPALKAWATGLTRAVADANAHRFPVERIELLLARARKLVPR